MSRPPELHQLDAPGVSTSCMGRSEEVRQARAEVDDFTLRWASFIAMLDERSSDDKTAFVWAGEGRRAWTGATWVRDVCRVGHRLQELSVAEGDEVATIAVNRLATLRLAFAAWAIGATFVPIDPRETVERRAEIIAGCAHPIFIGEAKDAPPGVRCVSGAYVAPSTTTETTVRPPIVGLDAIALRLQTSGTSGTPKPILIPMRALLLDCAAMHAAFGWDHRVRTLTVLPICHANGLVISSLLPWFSGGSSVLVDRFSARRFWPLVRQEGVTACSLVPTVLEYLIAYDGHTGGTGHLKEVFSGSGPLRPQTAHAFEERYGIPLRQLYGLSETSAVVTVTPSRKVGVLAGEWRESIGTAVPHVTLDVIDQSSESQAEGEHGEIVVRGGVLMLGYAGRRDATAAAFSGGWFHTGDRGYWRRGSDGRRWYFLDGRLGDSIRRGGVVVLPHTVETVLATHPSVERAAAFGFAHRWYGEEIAAAVIPRKGFDVDTFLDWCEQRLGYDTSPKAVVTLEALPTTTVGKIRRGVLAELLAPGLEKHWETRFPRHT